MISNLVTSLVVRKLLSNINILVIVRKLSSNINILEITIVDGLVAPTPIPKDACLRGCYPLKCMTTCTPPIWHIARCRSKAKMYVAWRPEKGEHMKLENKPNIAILYGDCKHGCHIFLLSATHLIAFEQLLPNGTRIWSSPLLQETQNILQEKIKFWKRLYLS